jgi:hypothetical protein
VQTVRVDQQNRVQAVLNEKVGGEHGVAGFVSGVVGLAKELQSSKGAVSLVGLPGPTAFLEKQLEGLIGQASTSRDVSLQAVNHLLLRDGKPAQGGVEIVWTGKGVGGARTKTPEAVERRLQGLNEAVEQLKRSFGVVGGELRELSERIEQEVPNSPEYVRLLANIKTKTETSENLSCRIGQKQAEIEALERSLS